MTDPREAHSTLRECVSSSPVLPGDRQQTAKLYHTLGGSLHLLDVARVDAIEVALLSQSSLPKV
jgi:hypothetical protein